MIFRPTTYAVPFLSFLRIGECDIHQVWFGFFCHFPCVWEALHICMIFGISYPFNLLHKERDKEKETGGSWGIRQRLWISHSRVCIRLSRNRSWILLVPLKGKVCVCETLHRHVTSYKGCVFAWSKIHLEVRKRIWFVEWWLSWSMSQGNQSLFFY